MSRTNQISKILKHKSFQELSEVGYANGSGNRARLIPSNKEKFDDARRQRKTWRNHVEF